jgi:putative sigma-54 modulation protein
MNINFTGRQTEISASDKKYCERRIANLEKHLGYPVEADIILSVEKYRNKAEINVKVKGGTLNTIEETHDMKSSLVAAFDHIEKRAKKEKEKIRKKKRRTKKELLEPVPSETETEQEARVIRHQQFSYKPITIEEAVLLFSKSRDEVMVFRKFDTEKWVFLYRRKDGNIGLAEPEE